MGAVGSAPCYQHRALRVNLFPALRASNPWPGVYACPGMESSVRWRPWSGKQPIQKGAPMTNNRRGSSEAARALSALGAAKGGAARAKKLTPERRSEIARAAALTRHGTDL